MASPLVQSALSQGAAPLALPFPSNNVGGNTLVVAALSSSTGDTIAISDTQGNTYVPLAPLSPGSGTTTMRLFQCVGCKPGANSVTVTLGVGGTATLAIHEFNGPTAFDNSASTTGTGTVQTSGPLTQAQASELLFGCTAGDGGGIGVNTLAGSDATWTQAQVTTMPNNNALLTQFIVVSTTGPFQAQTAASVGKSGTFHWADEILGFEVPAPPTAGVNAWAFF